jgi:hypothetical protein
MTLLGTERMLAAIRAYARFLTLQGLLEALSLPVLLKMPKWEYEAWNAALYSRISPGPHNSARSFSF